MLPRFFVASEEIAVEAPDRRTVIIAGEDAHHIHRVLRLRPGAKVCVVDDRQQEYLGTLAEVGRDEVRVELGPPAPATGEPAYRITLFQGLPKADKMDWVVQKAAEIGVDAVVPVDMERSVVSLSASKAEGRIQRWRRIAKSAAQQAARGRIPSIYGLATLAEGVRAWREAAPEGLLIVPWEEESAVGLRQLLRANTPVPKEIGIVIGPEGGLTQNEVDLCHSFGGTSCTLGPRILRTETAGTVVAGLILYELGEMGG